MNFSEYNLAMHEERLKGVDPMLLNVVAIILEQVDLVTLICSLASTMFRYYYEHWKQIKMVR